MGWLNVLEAHKNLGLEVPVSAGPEPFFPATLE